MGFTLISRTAEQQTCEWELVKAKFTRLTLLLTALALTASLVYPARAASSLYISPSNIPGQPSGTTLEYQVAVADIDPFNAWDITVRVDPGTINPVSVSLDGNVLKTDYGAQLLELAKCINGLGTNCSASDGPGIVRSAVVAIGSSFTSGTASGVLFTITYTAAGGPYSQVQILSDVIVNGDTHVVHTTAGATYGESPGPLVGGVLVDQSSAVPWTLYLVLVAGIGAVTAAVVHAKRKGEV